MRTRTSISASGGPRFIQLSYGGKSQLLGFCREPYLTCAMS